MRLLPLPNNSAPKRLDGQHRDLSFSLTATWDGEEIDLEIQCAVLQDPQAPSLPSLRCYPLDPYGSNWERLRTVEQSHRLAVTNGRAFERGIGFDDRILHAPYEEMYHAMGRSGLAMQAPDVTKVQLAQSLLEYLIAQAINVSSCGSHSSKSMMSPAVAGKFFTDKRNEAKQKLSGEAPASVQSGESDLRRRQSSGSFGSTLADRRPQPAPMVQEESRSSTPGRQQHPRFPLYNPPQPSPITQTPLPPLPASRPLPLGGPIGSSGAGTSYQAPQYDSQSLKESSVTDRVSVRPMRSSTSPLGDRKAAGPVYGYATPSDDGKKSPSFPLLAELGVQPAQELGPGHAS